VLVLAGWTALQDRLCRVGRFRQEFGVGLVAERTSVVSVGPGFGRLAPHHGCLTRARSAKCRAMPWGPLGDASARTVGASHDVVGKKLDMLDPDNGTDPTGDDGELLVMSERSVCRLGYRRLAGDLRWP
jgi:hypothetical protein